MYYTYPDFIRIVNYNETAICLNLISDRYFLFNQSCAEVLNAALSNRVLYDPKKVPPFLKSLLSENILQLSSIPNSLILGYNRSSGVENLDWRLDEESLKIKVPLRLMIESLYSLLKVHFIVKRKPHFLVKLLRDISLSNDFYIPDENEVNLLTSALNKATLIYPFKTKCYEWAIAYELMALKRKWKCNINLGVQNFPFRSHAWISCNGKPVADNLMLDELSIILSEPFEGVIV
jgi:hypothetical protein